MILPIKAIGIKIYNYNGEFKGYSNLLHISKNKIKNAKRDVEGATFGIFQFKVTTYKDGYKLSKNPIIYKN